MRRTLLNAFLLGTLILLAPVSWAQDAITYDFEAAANAGENPANKNGSAASGQGFYGWEKADKPDTKRQDYKGYEWAEGSLLPEICHVWRRSDRINGNVKDSGLYCPNDREMAIDGLEAGYKVVIIYDATNADDDSKELLWCIGDGTAEGGPGADRATATIDGVTAVTGETTIASGAEIIVNSVTPAENGTGYIVFRVRKGMFIRQIAIIQDTDVPVPVEGMLDVCGERVTEANAADILGDGAFSYDARTKTLHIKKSYEYNDSRFIHNWDIDGLTIAVDNDVTLTDTSYPDFAFYLWGNTTITGPSKLTLYGNISMIDGNTLTIDNADLELQLCSSYSIFGNVGGEKLIVRNSNIHANGYFSAICSFNGGITLEGCTLADGCVISEDGASILNASGSEAAEVTINKIDDDAVKDIPGTQKDCYFTLDGRKLQGSPSQQGIYIKDGKKVLVK